MRLRTKTIFGEKNDKIAIGMKNYECVCFASMYFEIKWSTTTRDTCTCSPGPGRLEFAPHSVWTDPASVTIFRNNNRLLVYLTVV